MDAITDSQTRELLAKSDDPEVRKLAKDVKMIKSLVGVLNASLKAAAIGDDPVKLAVFVSDKAQKLTDVAGQASGSKAVQGVSFIGSQTVKTLGLLKLADAAKFASPAKATLFITATLADKIVAAGGFVAESDVAKCRAALLSMSTTAGLGAFSCAGTAGILCIAAAVSVASEALNAYGQCRAVW